MKRLVVLALALGALLAPYAAWSETLRGAVIVVIDGDTLLFRPDRAAPRAFVKVRLIGIDAPEREQAGGEAATAALRALALKRVGVVEIVAVDVYGRKLGRLSIDGRDINADMVRTGHAWASVRDRDDPLRVLQREAQAARRGLWQHDDAVPPWRWRRARAGRAD